MIAAIDALLSRWGKWSVRRESSALGYSSVSPMFRDCATGGGYSPDFDPGFTPSDVISCDEAVNGLPVVLRVVVIAHYQRCGSFRDTAKDCGISHESVRVYLNRAHEILDIALSH